jgi:16S rRNA (adenine1518-N6/adenine1519-N6)-dimethyltransferase
MNVSRNCFVPAPNVDSVIIEMKKREKKYSVNNEERFFKLVRDSFKFKRKNLKNNLQGYDLEKICEVLSKYNLDLNVRAESLTIDQFVEISNNLN